MALGLGHLQIQPDQFWRMTPRELFAAADGYARRMGVDTEPPPTRAEARAWFENYEKEQREKAEREK